MITEDSYELRGLSTDKKPTNDRVPNGTVYLEIDTGKVFVYDKQNKVWYELK